MVGENAVLDGGLMDYTLIAGSNLVAWRYPARDVLKALPHETIDQMKLDVPKKYAKVNKSLEEINSVYISKPN